MDLAIVWVGHVRTFHEVWPEATVERLIEPLGATSVRHFFYTAPAAQCRRNRPNDPPEDYSADEALEYVKLALKPEHLEVRGPSQRAADAVARVRRARAEQGGEWVNLEALVHQYVRRVEAWDDFCQRVPEWRSLDAVVFNRPDVMLYDRIVAPAFPLKPDEIHTFTSLGDTKDQLGIDDRWCLGHPEAVDKYMRVGDAIADMYALEKRPWAPEENSRRHCDRSGLRIVKCAYQGPQWPAWAPSWERGHVRIVRFEGHEGRTLDEKLRRVGGVPGGIRTHDKRA